MERSINSVIVREKYFLLYLTLFVIVSSFSYGLVKGFRQTANASGAPAGALFYSEPSGEERALLPEGAKIVSLGSDAKINDASIAITSFFVDGTIAQFVQTQQFRWEQRGLRPVNRASSKRAVSVAEDRNSGRRYSLIVWQVPPIARSASNGYSLQGVLAISGAEQPDPRSSSLVPGVALRPGGTSGTVFSSEEFGGRSYTASYSNPGTLEDNLRFYRNELSASGWRERKSFSSMIGEESSTLQILEFSNSGEELTLLFSAVVEDQQSERTLVTIVRAPKAPRTS
ncbi:MAG: hypothetical protein KDD69_07755 [Bdellovibrionales bacterium]|nr:hypothetical protein [Bdellovibrionales bacterium]